VGRTGSSRPRLGKANERSVTPERETAPIGRKPRIHARSGGGKGAVIGRHQRRRAHGFGSTSGFADPGAPRGTDGAPKGAARLLPGGWHAVRAGVGRRAVIGPAGRKPLGRPRSPVEGVLARDRDTCGSASHGPALPTGGISRRGSRLRGDGSEPRRDWHRAQQAPALRLRMSLLRGRSRALGLACNGLRGLVPRSARVVALPPVQDGLLVGDRTRDAESGASLTCEEEKQSSPFALPIRPYLTADCCLCSTAVSARGTSVRIGTQTDCDWVVLRDPRVPERTTQAWLVVPPPGPADSSTSGASPPDTVIPPRHPHSTSTCVRRSSTTRATARASHLTAFSSVESTRRRRADFAERVAARLEVDGIGGGRTDTGGGRNGPLSAARRYEPEAKPASRGPAPTSDPHTSTSTRKDRARRRSCVRAWRTGLEGRRERR
jgi:hypothetical protein